MPAPKSKGYATTTSKNKTIPIPEGYDMVHKPNHYQSGNASFQVVDVIEQFTPDDPHLGHALTYLLRAGKKPGSSYVLDLEKAKWWIERAIQFATKTHPNG